MYIYLLERDYHEGAYTKTTRMAFRNEVTAYNEAMEDSACDAWKITELELLEDLESDE